MMSSLPVFLLLLFGFALEEEAAEAKELDTSIWSPELSIMYDTLAGSAVSPDGSVVAYGLRTAVTEGDKSEYNTQIHVVYVADGERLQFTRGDASASSPAFSPDGQWLTFLSKRGDKTQVWGMRLRGGEAQALTEAENGVASYQWSPDGTHIAFLMRDPDTKEEKKAKKEKRDVILVDQNYKYNHLYVSALAKDEDGKREPRRLTEGNFHITGFDWSPDGKAIAVSHRPDPTLNTGFMESDLSLVDVASGDRDELVTRPGTDSSPLFSPDGKWIAFSSSGGQPEPIGLSDIWLISADGGKPKLLAYTHDRRASPEAWAPDGKSIYVQQSVGTLRQIQAVPVKGKKTRTVTEAIGPIANIAYSADGRTVAFSMETPDINEDLYVSPLNEWRPKQITKLHEGKPQPHMGRTELLTWKSFDGLEIEGLLTYPVDYKEGSKVPLILNVHGGPAGVFTQWFTGGSSIYNIQYFAQNGFAVLRPNPRGSTGYGKAFRYANFQDWGYGDFEDLMSGVDKVIAMGVGDPDKLCLMGWSYGGYMTSFAVTRTDRFKAASMGAGLPNLISMTTTTDIPDYLVGHMGGEFWDDYETYEKHSAMYHIKKVVTPTQVIHGANDLRVPFDQGLEFYTALKRRGVPTEMIVYPRTPHGPREPKFVMDVSPRILAWFQAHLGQTAKTEAAVGAGGDED